ncbi:MAG: translation initiation factor IF-2 [Candidatus Krumholzibacteriota bacterium]|nr:translation initiation factor IF-2 [Candidatus Krumholzibacteriota bacterium]
MAKVRIYQLARKYEISSDALIKILVKEGIMAKSHMSTVEDRAEVLIEQHLDRVKRATSKQVQKKAKKKTAKTQKTAVPKKAEKPSPPEKEDKAAKKGRGKRAKKAAKRLETDQKAVKESVKRTLAKLEVTRKSKRRKRKEEAPLVEEEENIIKLPEYSTVADLAEEMEVDPAEIIQKCLGLGLMVSINQRLDSDTLEMVADEYGYKVKFVSSYGQDLLVEKKQVKPERLVERPPVVTIMGHVDHGKTSLLDNIRRSNIIAGEKGGITQHIGAYVVNVRGKDITFIDTPGHEAFTAMRARGAQSTDIVILIVAADDGVMPQTVEAINHARAADVPIIIAINKIDLPNADVEKVKRDLLQQNLVLEEYGGNVMMAEISAKNNIGIDHLLEMILLQAEMMELKADPEAQCRGIVLEACKEEGRGIACTVLVQQGTLTISDVFLTGNYSGRVRALHNERGQKLESATPGTPVVILGSTGVPQAGDAFNKVEDDRVAREIANKRQQYSRERERRTAQRMTLEDLYRQIQEGTAKELNIILRADTDGSIEVLADSLSALDTSEVRINIIHKAVGVINESDILLASASNAVVIGFHVSMAPKAARFAKIEKVDVRFYEVIYKAIDDIKAAMGGLLEPDVVEKDLGEAEVRQVFRVSKVGAVGGSYIKNGVARRNALVRVKREGEIIYRGTINSLRRFKEDVKEVQTGFECGIGIGGFEDLVAGDILEIYLEEVHSRTLD